MHSLVANHPFIDGNKRAGWNAAWTFLEVNDVAVLASGFDVDEAETLFLGVASGTVDDVTEIAHRLRAFAVPEES